MQQPRYQVPGLVALYIIFLHSGQYSSEEARTGTAGAVVLVAARGRRVSTRDLGASGKR